MSNNPSSTTSPSATNAVDGVLQQVFALQEPDRMRVYEVLKALHGAGSAESNQSTQSTALTGDEDVQPRPDELEGVKHWYEGLGGEVTNFERVQMIDEALEATSENASKTYLQSERRKILDDQPGVSVRVAVTRIATQQPMMVIVGFAGAVLGVISLARWVIGLIL